MHTIYKCLFCNIYMKLLVVAALPAELKLIRQWIKSANLKLNLDIDYLCSWVWNYETIFSLEKYLWHHDGPIFVLNVWVCWYWNARHEILKNPIQVASVVNLCTWKEIVCPPFLQLASFWTCFSSENILLSFPSSLNKTKEAGYDYYFDMESWWISFVSLRHKIPYLILKVPLDFLGSGSDLLSKGNYYNSLKDDLVVLMKNLPYMDFLTKILGRIGG